MKYILFREERTEKSSQIGGEKAHNLFYHAQAILDLEKEMINSIKGMISRIFPLRSFSQHN